MSEKSKVVSFFEGVVVLAILLVLAHTFLQDWSALFNWSWEFRRMMLFISFGFDLFFTIEFLVRFFYAVSDHRVSHYFWDNRGWIDVTASVPLLLLNSGPTVYGLLFGGGIVLGTGSVFGVLKVIKVVRIARILRLLRVLKIFRRIKNANSLMAQRHLAKITTMTITTIVLVLVLVSVADSLFSVPDLATEFEGQVRQAVEQNVSSGITSGQLALFTSSHPTVIRIVGEDQVYFNRFDEDYFQRHLGPSDYLIISQPPFNVYMDLRSVLAQEARDNLIHFGIIVALVIVFLFLYSPHFALTISDPIHIMNRGFAERTYNLRIKIPPRYHDDDVYHLADRYNEVYLPLKDRSADEDDLGSEIDIGQLQKFLLEE